MKKLLLGLVLLACSFAATAGKNTPHDPAKFVAYSSDQRFEVAEDFRYNERRGIGVRWEQGIRAGAYVAQFQDSEGYYYFGPDTAVCQANPSCTGWTADGGVWVSKGDPGDIRLFTVFVRSAEERRNGRQFGALINWLAERENGKIFIFPRNDTFIARMRSYSTQSEASSAAAAGP